MKVRFLPVVEQELAHIASPSEVAPLYVGPGHTTDNIVVWFPRDKVLFGGCMLKCADAKDLGYIGESNLSEWGNSLRRLQEKVRGVEHVIPGHGDVGGTKLILHTEELLLDRLPSEH
ncbi:MAG: MBL fold metallo-hydrolase [Candidatus Ozemobacteraceae bacterium]